jgi:hypothetical protein
MSEEEKWREFRRLIANARRREEQEKSEWETRTVEAETQGSRSIRQCAEVKYFPSPKWIVETLLEAGIHREPYTSAYDLTALMLEHHSRYDSDEKLGLATGKAEGMFRGGTCSWINASRGKVLERCKEIQGAIRKLNESSRVARHIAVIRCNKSTEKPALPITEPEC